MIPCRPQISDQANQPLAEHVAMLVRDLYDERCQVTALLDELADLIEPGQQPPPSTMRMVQELRSLREYLIHLLTPLQAPPRIRKQQSLRTLVDSALEYQSELSSDKTTGD